MTQQNPSIIRLLAIGLLLVAAPASAQWGGASLFTQDGVEVTVDKRVFAVFALLNAHGYDDDTELGPHPLRRPKFSQAREEVRERFRRPGPAVKQFLEIVKNNPAPVEEYIKAALTLGDAPKFAPGKDTTKLGKALSPALKSWYSQEGGAAAYRAAAASSRASQKAYLEPTDALVKKVTGAVRFGNEEDALIDESGAQGRVVLVINDLDAHDSLRRFDMGDTTWIVTGPPSDKDHVNKVARTVGIAYGRTLVAGEVEKGAKDAFQDLYKKLPKGLRRVLQNPRELTTELIACALVQRTSPGDCSASPVEGVDYKAELQAIRERLDASDKAKELLRAALPKITAPITPPAPPATPKPPAG